MMFFRVRSGRVLAMSVAVLSVGLPLGVGLDAPTASATTLSPTCSVASLITDINAANATVGGATLDLPSSCTYDLTAADNTTDGPTGLPVVTNSVTVDGNSSTITRDSTAGDFRIFNVGEGGNLTLEDLTVSNGNASADPAGDAGGGIFTEGTLTIIGTTVSGSSAQQGGGIATISGSTTSVSNSTVSGNSADDAAGSACNGGGIFTQADLTVTGSTFSGNQAGIGCGVGVGGAIQSTDNPFNVTVDITNSTFAGNSAGTGGALDSDGVVVPNTNVFNISSSTIAGNFATFGGGIDNGATATLTDSIVTANSGQNCAGGAVTDGGYNDVSDTSCLGATSPTSAGSLSGNADIGTLSLGTNGSTGPETEAITSSSSAFDLAAAKCPATDERGEPRPGDASQTNCDAGAFELQVTQPPKLSEGFDPPSIPVNGTSTLTLTITNPNATVELTGLQFTDVLPVGLVVANPPDATLAICNETVTGATAGSTSFGLPSPGGTLGGGDHCEVTVNVTSATAGEYTNTVSGVTSNEGGTGNSATADLTVVAPPTIGKAFGESSMDFGQSTSLTITVSNPNATTLNGVAFSDTLPSGLMVSVPTTVGGSCSGTSTAGGSLVTLSGSQIDPGSSCTVTTTVTAVGVGNQVNVTGDVTSTEGGTGGSATASIMVNPAPLDVTISGSELWAFPPIFDDSVSLPNDVGIEGDPSCSEVDGGRSVSSLPDVYDTYTLESSSCGGLTLTGADADDYVIDYIGGDFSVYASGTGVTPAPLPPGAPSGVYGQPTSAEYSTGGGASITVNYGGATAIATVPPGALAPGTFVSLFPDINPTGITLPAGDSYVSGFALSWFLPGSPFVPTATVPITLSITDSAIGPNSVFFQETATGLVPVTGVVSGDTVTFSFTGDPAFVVANPSGPAPTSVPGPPAPTQTLSGSYDLVGSDGGVFAFGSSPFYGSLPKLGIAVHNIVGIVPTSNEEGYYLVGSDGGVFAFGNATYEKSLPQLGVAVNDIVGIVPTKGDQGYFLVGKDGGVFSFGDAPFENSLPGEGIHVDDIVGIAATSDDGGYWLVSSTGEVYALGDATNLGSAPGGGIVSIAATNSGDGYWLTASNGTVYPLGDAHNESDLPAIGVKVSNIVSLIPSQDGLGYLLIGRDGGVFAFGDAGYPGSLPGIGVNVNNIVGAVSTG
jgi:uncharacterized repeat protein (TIGR01451 family)